MVPSERLLVVLLFLTATRAEASVAENRTFPPGFLFGCATASYQVEGAWNESGKGENIWDRMIHTNPGSIVDSSSGDVACDSYHKYKEDVALLKDLGAGVAYYNSLITELLSKGIKPMVTLYHWDLPQVLQDLGGWPNPLMANFFVDYANLAFGLFGDRVKLWITFNEPCETCVGGYGVGGNAPHVGQDGVADYLCAHTILRAHAKAYHLYHRKFAAHQQGKVGITLNTEWFEALQPTDEHRLAAERAQQFKLGWFAHPIFSETGDYPPVMRQTIMAHSLAQGLPRSRLPDFTPAEVKSLRGAADFLGLNHYTTDLAEAMPTRHRGPKISRVDDMGVELSQDPSWPNSASGWLKVVPWGFRKILVWVRDQFDNPPLFVTENGYSDHGDLHDKERISYYMQYLEQLLLAIKEDGCNVLGYMAWSLMDNFEWNDGYTARFGLHYVNFSDPARPRIPKDSAALFRKITSTRSLPSAEEKEIFVSGRHRYQAEDANTIPS